MSIIEAALRYAAVGFPVLALYGTKDGECLCPEGATCKSPGKHPHPKYCPNGVHSATLDPEEIARWAPDVNIGVALGHKGVMAFDVDEREVASKLLHPSVGLSDHTGVVFTGRAGAHVWFRTTGSVKTFHIRDARGRKIGEVRGEDSYVVVPPSQSAYGRRYKWIGHRQEEPPPVLEIADDAFEFASTLLKAVDVEVTPPQKTPQILTEPGEILGKVKECGIPPELIKDSRLFDFRQLLLKKVPPVQEPDRSGRLMHLAHLLVAVSQDKLYPITTETIAGVLKKADATIFKEPKYAGRADCDRYYWEMALAAALSEEEKPEAEKPQDSEYVWDESDGCLYYHQQKSVRKVANFRAEVLEDLVVDLAVEGEQAQRAWRVRCVQKGGNSEEILLTSDDFGSSMALEHALASALGSSFHVAAGMYGHLKASLTGTQARPGKVFGMTGWVEYGGDYLYLLPSASGAVKAGGLETSVRIDKSRLPRDSVIVQDNLSSYGKGVRPPVTSEERAGAWEAFSALMACGPDGVVMPVILQIMAGPLTSAGAGEVPPLVHVMGRTGTLKTTYCQAASSIFATFTGSSPAPASWSYTPMSLRVVMHTAKDLTLLIDDYKRSTVRSKSGIIELIQNYADKASRGAATPTHTLRAPLPPRGLILSNGEDRWEQEASAGARTILVYIKHGDIDLDLLTAVQKQIGAGYLQLFGGAYLSWLASQTELLDGLTFGAEREAWHQRLRAVGAEKGTVHLRILASLSTLLTVSQVIERFIMATFGEEEASVFKKKVKGAVQVLLGGMGTQAKEVEEASPFNLFVQALEENLSARAICIWPGQGVTEDRHSIPSKPNLDVAAYYFSDNGEPQWVLLTRETSFGWYEKECRKQGREPSFTWTAFMKEAEERGGRKADRVRVVIQEGQVSQLSGIALPSTLFPAIISHKDEGEGVSQNDPV